MSKLLLYCTKGKPYLVQGLAKPMHTLDVNNPYNFNWKLVNKGFSTNRLNGKVIAECDFEVEEIKYFNDEFGEGELYTETLNIEELEKRSCTGRNDLSFYLENKYFQCEGYAIYIKNLKIFDEPKDIVHYGTNAHYDDEGYTETNMIWKAPSRMMEVYEFNKWYSYFYTPMQSEEMCRILNGEQTIIIRKKVLKGML